MQHQCVGALCEWAAWVSHTWADGPWYYVSWWGTSLPASQGCGCSPPQSLPSFWRSLAGPAAAAPSAHTAGPDTSAAPPAGHGSLPGWREEEGQRDRDEFNVLVNLIMPATVQVKPQKTAYTGCLLLRTTNQKASFTLKKKKKKVNCTQLSTQLGSKLHTLLLTVQSYH